MRLPSWARELRGAERLTARKTEGRRTVVDAEWVRGAGPLTTIGVTLPVNLRRWADAVDPLLPTYLVAESMRLLQAQLDDVVLVARERGKSWSQIAQALGVSKQAAWERYGRLERSA